MYVLDGALGERLAVTDGDHARLHVCQPPQRFPVLPLVEVEAGPAGIEARPGRHRVADDEHVALLAMKGHRSRRVPGDVQHAKRTDLISLVEAAVDRARRVLGAPEREPDPHRGGGERAARPHADGLCEALAGDDVGLPLVRVHDRPAEPLQGRQAAEMRAMRVGERDVREIARGSADRPDPLEHHRGVRVEERVHERQLVAVLEQIGVYAPTLRLAEAVHPVSDLHQPHSMPLDYADLMEHLVAARGSPGGAG